MAVDPNVYALQVSLAMDTVQAEQALDQFGESMTAFEDQLADSATKAFGSIEKTLSSITDGLSDISKYATMSVKDMQEEVKKLQQQQKIHDEFEDFAETEINFRKEVIKHLDDMIERLETKNELHAEENDYLGREIELNRQVEEGTERVRDNVRATDEIFRKMIRSITHIGQLLEASDATAEKFVTTNWRAYGTQQMLAQEVRGLTMEYGILRDEAEAAMIVMGTMKVPRDELTKYAKVVAQTTRWTGVAADTLGVYARRMRQAGLDSEQLERHLIQLSDLMRKYKLSTEDMNKVMSDTTLSASMLNTIFKSTTEGETAAEQYTKLRAAMVGVGGAANYSADEVLGFANRLEDPIERMKFAAQAGMRSINSMDDYAKATARVGKRISDLRKQYVAMGIPGEQIQLMLDRQAKAWGVADGKQMLMLADMYETTEGMQIQADTLDGLTAAFDRSVSDGMNPWSEANWTLTRQLQILRQTLGETLKYVLEPLRYALMVLVFALNVIIQPIARVIKAFGDFWAWLESIPLLGYFFKAVKLVAGVLGILVVGLVMAGSALAGLALTVGLTTGVFRGALAFIQLFGTAVLQLARIIGQAIVILLESIGKGLAAMLTPLKGLELPLLALGAALLMAGAGAWLFAQGIAVLANVSWNDIAKGIVMMAAMTAILVIALYAIAASAPVAAVAVPILLAVGAALLLMGLAAFLAGAGMYLMAQSLEAIATFGPTISPMTWLKLAAGIAMLGAAALIAGPGLLAAGAGLLMMATAAWILANALTIALNAVKEFGEEAIVSISKAVLTASLYFLGAAAALALIGPLLVIAAAGIWVGAGLLIVAIPILAVAAALLVIAAGTMITGGALLFIGAVALLAGSAMLALAGTLALLGAGSLGLAASIIFPAALAIGFAALILLPAAGALLLAAIALVPIGLAIAAAGVSLWLGGLFLGWGARKLKRPALEIYEAASKISRAAEKLGPAVNVIGNAAELFDTAIKAMKAIDSEGFAKAMDALEDAIPSIRKFVDEVADLGGDIGTSVQSFASAMSALRRALSGVSAIGEIRIPEDSLMQLDETLRKYAGRLEESVAMFKKPADELTTVLSNLGDAIAGFGNVGDILGENLDQLIAELDTYAVELDAVATRIETALETKAVPAVRAAEEAGIKEAIKSEAVTAVEVMPAPTMEDRESGKITALLEEQNGILQTVADFLSGLSGEEVVKIKELLESHMNAARVPDTGMSSNLNRWMS